MKRAGCTQTIRQLSAVLTPSNKKPPTETSRHLLALGSAISLPHTKSRPPTCLDRCWSAGSLLSCNCYRHIDTSRPGGDALCLCHDRRGTDETLLCIALRVVAPPHVQPLGHPRHVRLQLLQAIARHFVHGFLGVALLGFFEHHLHDLALHVLPHLFRAVAPATRFFLGQRGMHRYVPQGMQDPIGSGLKPPQQKDIECLFPATLKPLVKRT